MLEDGLDRCAFDNAPGAHDDVANAVLFLAGDMAKWITGAYLVVDGGGLA